MLTVEFDDHGEGHDEDGHEQVGDGERHEEEVGHVLESSLPAHGQTHEHVAQDAGDDDQDQRESAPPYFTVHHVVAGRRGQSVVDVGRSDG